jgi:septation ring formation regulator EzrA
MKKSELKQLIKEEILRENSSEFINNKKKLVQSIDNSNIIDLLKYFSTYYKSYSPLNRLFTSSYKQLEKIKDEIDRYQPRR